jgi:NAD(P)-dependent dehydrogenase (short-subunit alcohol dehydrogenase family)
VTTATTRRCAPSWGRIEAESGALHLLINNAWAGYERLNAGGWEEWVAPFWDQPLELWDAMFDGGVRTHYVATALCARLLRGHPRWSGGDHLGACRRRTHGGVRRRLQRRQGGR